MRISDITTSDFKDESYWWTVARPTNLEPIGLQDNYDVAIVGSGFTGLRAALALARGGARVVVLEKDSVGFGASRRNAGFLGRVLERSYVWLRKHVGKEYALRVYRELNDALQTTIGFVEREGINCYAQRGGRFIAANSPRHLSLLIDEMQAMKEDLGWDYRLVDKNNVTSEMASPRYCGGVVVPDLGSIHSGLYHQGLVDLAIKAGVAISTQTEVLEIKKDGSGHRVETNKGPVRASKVVVATNGYTPPQFKWHRRRVIPFTGYVAATEQLPAALLSELIPNRRTIADCRLDVDFFRIAPDSPRLLFGGATGSPLHTGEEIAMRMHSILTRTFPQLSNVKLSAAWSGQCAATFDRLPHIGCSDGIYYGMGYNFAGVPMGSYFGEKLAQMVLGKPHSESVFSEKKFPTIPGYNGEAWFTPLLMKYFNWKDDRIARAAG